MKEDIFANSCWTTLKQLKNYKKYSKSLKSEDNKS